jgi:release factor H-coupled RctB family protein
MELHGEVTSDATTTSPASVQVLARAESWIEGEAVRQLEATARLPGMRLAVGLPDLHPGVGTPVGAVFGTEGIVYPALVGNDIGCGMALWRTDLSRRKPKLDRWAKKLSLDTPWEGDAAAWLAAHAVPAREGAIRGAAEAALGTIGGGNHFAELQVVEEVADAAALEALGLDRDRIVLLVHSGSRGLGEAILRRHVDVHRAAGLPERDAAEYLAQHDRAVRWAVANRALIARRFLDAIGAEGAPVLDVCHNLVVRAAVRGRELLLHRKGAAPADAGPVPIPGSRGALTWLVRPVGDLDVSARSLAHGAGRKWKRSECKDRLRNRFRPDDLLQTELGGRVVCDDRALLYEEAPQAYKRIDRVVGDLFDRGLVEVIATLRPQLTYKTRGRE